MNLIRCGHAAPDVLVVAGVMKPEALIGYGRQNRDNRIVRGKGLRANEAATQITLHARRRLGWRGRIEWRDRWWREWHCTVLDVRTLAAIPCYTCDICYDPNVARLNRSRTSKRSRGARQNEALVAHGLLSARATLKRRGRWDTSVSQP
jgi:hypothetical protein